VFLIAYPLTAVIPPLSMLSFTYNLSSDLYPVKGLDAQLIAEVAPDLDNTNYWIGSMVFYGLILFIMIIAMFNVCCRDYDPLNEFESRRKKQAKGRKLEDEKVRKQELKRKKEINKKNWAKGKFSNIDEEEIEEEDDTERGLPKKGGK
jgi:hypothetical protein